MEEDRSSHPSCPCDGSSQKGYDDSLSGLGLEQNQKKEEAAGAGVGAAVEVDSEDEEKASVALQLGDTTCSWKAFRRGRGQKVIAFTYFEVDGNAKEAEQATLRKYLPGIRGNLEDINKHYPKEEGWTMRLYHDLGPAKLHRGHPICKLACEAADNLDLCNVNDNPMFGNASVLFPTIWRFLPLFDRQVRHSFSGNSIYKESEKEARLKTNSPYTVEKLLWGRKLCVSRQKMESNLDNHILPLPRRPQNFPSLYC